MKIEFDGPDMRWLKETAREALAVCFLAPASVLYRIGSKLSPVRITEPEEDLSWQEETPEVSQYRSQMKIPTRQERERAGRGTPTVETDE